MNDADGNRGHRRRVFLSYAQEDKATARRVADALKQSGVQVRYSRSRYLAIMPTRECGKDYTDLSFPSQITAISTSDDTAKWSTNMVAVPV